MGDMILTLPVIQGIKQKNPQATIHVVASQKNLKICRQFSLIDKIYEKSNSSSAFNNLTKSISTEKYDYYFAFSPGWFGLFLGFFSKSKFKSSLILKSRYKSNLFSKIWQIIFSKIFFSLSLVLNRFKSLHSRENIHQTNVMMDVVLKSGLATSENIKPEFKFKNVFTLEKDKPVCVIHLSSKWINKYYSEDHFEELLKSLKDKNLSIYLTSDETTKNKFSKIFDTYPVVDDPNNLLNNMVEISICNNFNFENWISLINQADYVITPESGCTHIASLTNCKLAVLYDSDNSPKSIMHEYAPWSKEYMALETNDKELNKKLLNFI
jgi:ADP-heptose:LPS heptosyltransferase